MRTPTALLVASVAVLASAGCSQAPQAVQASATPAPVAAAPVEHWHITRESSGLDGATTATIQAESWEEGKPEFAELGINRPTNSIVIRCGKQTDAYVTPWSLSGELGGGDLDADTDGGQGVRYRIGSGAVQSAHWSMSKDEKSLFVPASSLRKMEQGGNLVLEYQPQYVKARTATIPLAGLGDAMKSAGCHV